MRNRAALLGGVIAAALVVVVVAILVSQGGADEETPTEPANGTAAPTAQVRQQGIVLGDPHAPVTMIEFVDMQCPFCAEYATSAYPAVVRDFVRTGELKIELRVLAFLGPDSATAARFAAATAEQDKLFDFAELFFANQGPENSGYVTEGFLRDLARRIDGLDVDKAFADARSARARKALQEAAALANELGVEGTPAFYLQRGDGAPEPLEVTSLDAEGFTAELEQALQQ